jgi:hypothetical protein
MADMHASRGHEKCYIVEAGDVDAELVAFVGNIEELRDRLIRMDTGIASYVDVGMADTAVDIERRKMSVIHTEMPRMMVVRSE